MSSQNYREGRDVILPGLREKPKSQEEELSRKEEKYGKPRLCYVCKNIKTCSFEIIARGELLECPDFELIENKKIRWENATRFYPYTADFDKKLKEEIKKKDGYNCQLCGISEMLCIHIYGRKLVIHHIDYNKTNSQKENLIALCPPCNTRVNAWRPLWILYFKKILCCRPKKPIQIVNRPNKLASRSVICHQTHEDTTC